MGIALSSMCAAPILRWGKQAMADCEAHRVTPELTEIIEAIIISTGYVSNFVQVDYTTGMAHAMYNGFTILTHSGLTTYIEQDEFPELNAAYKKTAWWKATHVQK